MSLRVVFDTNVIVSGLLNKKSVPRFAFRLAKAKGTILQSEPTLEELATVLKRKKFDRYFSKDDRISFLLYLLKFVEYLEPTVTITVCRDEKDNKFLELAVSGEATHIVTGDDDLLVLHPFQGIDILTPAAFLELNISDDEEN